MTDGGENITVTPVRTRRELKRFVRFVDDLYREDPAYVAPLMFERLSLLDRRRNPYFRHAEAAFWIAWRKGRPVGRISAQIDELAVARAGRRIGHFGMFECVDDPQVAAALFATAEDWLATRGAVAAQGPYNLSTNGECGLLVDGFATPPAIMMGHARPYYGRLLEEQGYAKVKDLFAYDLDVTKGPPRRITKIVEAGHRNPDILMRPLDTRRYEEELALIVDIYNDAWSENWGFVPLTLEEGRHLAHEIRPLIRRDCVFICFYKGEPAAMMVTLPDINRIIQDFRGRLLPFNWARFLSRLYLQPIRHFRVPLMGVRKAYQRSLAGAQMALMMIEATRIPNAARGAKRAELSWILEDNKGMRDILEEIGCVIAKTYRIYEKPLV